MRILITGAAGFIGSHLMDALGEHHRVGVDNFLTGQRINGDGVLEMDITERHRLYDLANGYEPDLIIHCAASYSDPDLWHRDTQTNVEGAINVAAVAKHHSARVIYFQTILPPISSYAISKIAAQQYLELAGVPLTVLRLANIYGPRNLSGPIPVFYKRLTQGQSCVVVDTAREMVYIDDLVRCVLQVIEETRLGMYDVCTGHQVSIMELFSMVQAEVGTDQVPPLIPKEPDDVQGVVVPYRNVPGWKATTPLRDGIAKTVASYREAGVSETHTHLRLKG